LDDEVLDKVKIHMLYLLIVINSDNVIAKKTFIGGYYYGKSN